VFPSCITPNDGRVVERPSQAHVSTPWIASSPSLSRLSGSLRSRVNSRLRSEEVEEAARQHPALVGVLVQAECRARHL
jgi:hypothetical protein